MGIVGCVFDGELGEKSGDHEIQYESMNQREKTACMNLTKRADGEKKEERERERRLSK